MPFVLQTHDSARAFLDVAQPWLLQSEAEHSLFLGIAGRLAEAPDASRAYLATVHHGGSVAGVAVRTPPLKLLLSRMPLGAVPLVAESAERFASLPAVLAPDAVGWAFADEWARRRGVTSRLAMRERVFELTRLVAPERPAPGCARVAGAGDVGRVRDWIEAFHRDVGMAEPDPGGWAERHVAAGRVLLWDHGGAVAMAAQVRQSPTGASVGAVYTPPASRGRGYASAVVAELSRRLLAGGRRFCSLYTDLANPTSNALYQRLGYRPVADVVDLAFDAA